MGASIVFFFSLSGIIVLLSLKAWELKRGAKPFSAFRYRVDAILRRQALELDHYLAYVNWQTAKLLFSFLTKEALTFSRKILDKVENSKISHMIRGRGSIDSTTNGTASTYLKDISSFKEKTTKTSDEVEAKVDSTENI